MEDIGLYKVPCNAVDTTNSFTGQLLEGARGKV